jgi:hypothetical protein
MTLIVLSCTERAAIIASDTRLSWNGKLTDDNSAKAGCITFYDGRLIYAYTGLAKWNSFVTRQWLLEVLAEKIGPWVAANDALLVLKNRAIEDFANLPVLKGVSRYNKRLTVAFAGYVGKQPVGAVLSNFENYAGGVRYAEAQDQFFLSCWPSAPGQTGWWCSYFGATNVIPPADIADLEKLVAMNKPLEAIKGKMESIIVRASRDDKAQGIIGANVLSATLLPNREHFPSGNFTSEPGADKILMLDQFSALIGLVIHSAEIAAPKAVAPRQVQRHRRKRDKRLR